MRSCGVVAKKPKRRNPTADIHCVSKQDIDAPRVAGALGAQLQLVGRRQECASRRPFHPDSKTRRVIAAALDGVE